MKRIIVALALAVLFVGNATASIVDYTRFMPALKYRPVPALDSVVADTNRHIRGILGKCLNNNNCTRRVFVTSRGAQCSESSCTEITGTNIFDPEDDTFLLNVPANTLLDVYAEYTFAFNAPRLSLRESPELPATLNECFDQKVAREMDTPAADESSVIRLTAEFKSPFFIYSADSAFGGHNRTYLRAGVDGEDVSDVGPYVEVGFENTNGVDRLYWLIDPVIGAPIVNEIPDSSFNDDAVLYARINNCGAASGTAGIKCANAGATDDDEWEVCIEDGVNHWCKVFDHAFLDANAIPRSQFGPGSGSSRAGLDSTCGTSNSVVVPGVGGISQTDRTQLTTPVYRTSVAPMLPELGDLPASTWVGGTSSSQSTQSCCNPGQFICLPRSSMPGPIDFQYDWQYELHSGTQVPIGSCDSF